MHSHAATACLQVGPAEPGGHLDQPSQAPAAPSPVRGFPRGPRVPHASCMGIALHPRHIMHACLGASYAGTPPSGHIHPSTLHPSTPSTSIPTLFLPTLFSFLPCPAGL